MKIALGNRRVRAAVYRRQGGVVLYVALVVMVVMMLAGVSLLRSAGTGQGVAGNLAFKQNATSGGERGVNEAISSVKGASTVQLAGDNTLPGFIPLLGYFASWGPVTPGGPQPPPFDPATFAWDNNPALSPATVDSSTGNSVVYVIHRLCPCSVAPGQACPTVPVTINACVLVMDGQSLGTAGGGASSSGVSAAAPPPYFRVTTRTVGPRNTVSYTQVVFK
jgi:Tfp pilus assembly protein PilX